MNDAAHTKGPWVAEKDAHTSGSFNIIGDGIRLAIVTSGPTNHDRMGFVDEQTPTQGRANARLMAAAPTLLAALKDARATLEQVCEGQHPDNVCCHHLRAVSAAIALSEST